MMIPTGCALVVGWALQERDLPDVAPNELHKNPVARLYVEAHVGQYRSAPNYWRNWNEWPPSFSFPGVANLTVELTYQSMIAAG
jgi:hypothetical protein